MKKTIGNTKELNMDSLLTLIKNKEVIQEVRKNEVYCDLYTYVTFDNLPSYLQDEISSTVKSDLNHLETQTELLIQLEKYFNLRLCNSIEFKDEKRLEIDVYGNFLEVYSEKYQYEKMFPIQPSDDLYTANILKILTENVEN